jgi:alanyl-tRNA synthetase
MAAHHASFAPRLQPRYHSSLAMTERLYYQNSFVYDFTGHARELRLLLDGRPALVLDRTAFYATSGGQPHDTGWIEFVDADGKALPALPKLRVAEVVEDAGDGELLHIIDVPCEDDLLKLNAGEALRGFVDVERRQDHMQQHSGQHVLSAVFLKLFEAPTISFHLGEESCTIDVECKSLTAAQAAQAELAANRVVWEDRQVLMHEATVEQAKAAGVRKLPEAAHERLRLIEVRGIDLCACGGTHVLTTGQIGNIQLRKLEKFKQGVRVEFVCGARALRTARRDYQLLVETAALYSAHTAELPAQTAKLLEANRAAGKQQQALLAEIAELRAVQLLAQTESAGGCKIVARLEAERDAGYIKLLAQKLAAVEPNVIALLASPWPTPTLVFAQSPGGKWDAGAALKALLAAAGGRGGGTRELAQGGVPSAEALAALLEQAAAHAAAQAATQARAEAGA